MFVLVNSVGKYLSGFYPNAGRMRLMLAFRKCDWYSYPTKEEAEQHLATIHRYGIGKALSVKEVANEQNNENRNDRYWQWAERFSLCNS